LRNISLDLLFKREMARSRFRMFRLLRRWPPRAVGPMAKFSTIFSGVLHRGPRNRSPGSAGCPALLQTLQTTSARARCFSDGLSE
jgi:hypothetical protein